MRLPLPGGDLNGENFRETPELFPTEPYGKMAGFVSADSGIDAPTQPQNDAEEECSGMWKCVRMESGGILRILCSWWRSMKSGVALGKRDWATAQLLWCALSWAELGSRFLKIHHQSPEP